MRWVGAIALLLVGAALIANSYGSLRYLWADYRDSPLALYMVLAAVQIGLGTLALVGALKLFRRQ